MKEGTFGRQMCSVGVGSEAGKGEGDRNEGRLAEEQNWGNGDVKYYSYDIVGNMKVDVRMFRMGGC